MGDEVKRLIFILVVLLSGCTSKLYLELYNNSASAIIVGVVEEVRIEPGGSVRVEIFTSMRNFTIESGQKKFEYSINLRNVPGHFFSPGTIHKLMLQVEPDYHVYLIRPPGPMPFQDLENVDQPIGFPLIPK